MPDLSLEKELKNEGYSLICGVDEAGRGPLCGPVVAAACILPADYDIPELNASKKLTAKKREKLFDIVKEQAVAYAIASATPEEIDSLNILNADMLAMRRAIEALSPAADFALMLGSLRLNDRMFFTLYKKILDKSEKIWFNIRCH